MKAFIQTLLIAGGILGLLGTIPIALFANAMRSFGGDLTVNDRIIIAAPFLAGIALVIGLLWRKFEKKKTSA